MWTGRPVKPEPCGVRGKRPQGESTVVEIEQILGNLEASVKRSIIGRCVLKSGSETTKCQASVQPGS